MTCCDHNLKGRIQSGEAGPVIRLSRREIVSGLAVGSIAVVASGCVTNPETGRVQLSLASDAQVAELAASAWDEQKKSEKISTDPVANRRLRNVGERIAQASGRASEPWEFVVFDSPTVNAFVLPGNHVGFYKGLMNITVADDHMAAVLGHEVGHVTGGHVRERVSQQMAAAGIGTALGVAAAVRSDSKTAGLLAAAFGVGSQLALLKFSRDQESEADRLGVDYMVRAGYKAPMAVDLWERMAANAAASGAQKPPEFLSTHPSDQSRIENLRKYINSKGYAVV